MNNRLSLRFASAARSLSDPTQRARGKCSAYSMPEAGNRLGVHFAVIPGASRDSIGNETRHCVEVFKARGHMRGVINNHASRSSCRSQNAKYFRNKFLVALLRRALTAQDPHIHGIPRNCSERYLDPQRGALDEACGAARAARRAGLDETQEERARQYMQQSATDKSGSSGAPHEFFWPKMPR